MSPVQANRERVEDIEYLWGFVKTSYVDVIHILKSALASLKEEDSPSTLFEEENCVMYIKNYTFCKMQNVMKEARLTRLNKELLEGPFW